MPFRPCPSGCGRFLSADDGHDRCLQCLGRRHAEAAFVDDSCVCCGRMSMISLRSRLSFMKGLAPSAATRADLSGSSRGSPADALGDLRVTVRASPPGTPPRTSYSSRSEHPVRFPGDFAGLSHGAPSISFGAPSVDRMSIAASGDGFTSSEDEGAVGLPPSGVVATAAPDPELTAMLARAAVSIGLEVNRPPSPEPSRLDDWFLGAGRGSQPRPAPVPFFPEVHEELTSSWMAPFTARSRSSASSVLTTLDGGVARGYAGIPQVERAVAVHWCPRNAATWRNRPRLPSKACKLTAALAAKAYSAAGQAASALHAMAILQVHQAKALKQVHEGSTDPGLMQELRTATDFALRATKVTARSLGKAMSTMVVQERHLCLNLAEMKDVDKARFLDAPISQRGLFGDTVEGFAQQFSAVQQQTEAIQHILPRRDAPSTAAPGARPRSARRRGRPPVSSRAAPPQAESTHRPVRRASRRRAAPPASQPGPKSSRKSTKRPWRGQPGDVGVCSFSGDGENSAAPSPGGGPGGESSVSFCFCSAAGPRASGTHLLKERANFFSSGFSGPWDDSVRRPASSLSPTTHFASSQESTVRGRHSSPRTSGQSRSGPREFGEDASERSAFCAIHPYSLSLHLHRYVDCAVGAACTASGGVAHAAQPVSLAHAHNSTRLRDSVRQATSQGQRRSRDFGGSPERPCLARGNCCPPGKGCNRAGPSSRDEAGILQPLLHRTQERWWPSANPGSASLEPGFAQAPVQDADAQAHDQMHSAPGLVCSDRPEGRLLSRFDPSATQTVLRFAFEGRAWQYRVLPFGLSLSPRVFTKVVEGALTPLREVGVRILNYLDDWLILAQSREQLGDHRDLVLRHLSQLGLRVNWEKSKLSPVQRISFLGVELDSVSMTARLTEERAQAVLNCLSSFRGRNVVPLKQFQRLLGHMASAAAVTPLGLLHMRPLQHWLHSRVPRWAWRRGTLRVGISQQCRRSLSPWTDLAFLRAGVPLEQVSRHTVVTTDASSTGWGATCNGQAASGLWTGPRLLWHINCLELWAVHLALRQFRPLLLGKHVLVRTDNTAAVSYINRLGGIRSHRMSQLARHLLLWSHTQFKSLRAVHIPGQLNRAADALSRQLTFPGEWRLHPETIRLIWSRFGEAQVDLFASPESSHCQLYFSLTEGPLGTDTLAHSWPRALRKYAFPPVSLLAQTLCKLREDEEQVLLVAPHWPTRTWFPELISLATVPPWRIPLRKDLLSQGLGTIWHPRPDLWNLHVWLLDGTRQTWVVYHRRW